MCFVFDRFIKIEMKQIYWKYWRSQ